MAKYRKKPVVIEAFRLTWESVLDITPKEKQVPEWAILDASFSLRLTDKIQNSEYALIKTLEGTMTANDGDWIIKGVNGEIYPCKPDIFEKTYELVREPTLML